MTRVPAALEIALTCADDSELAGRLADLSAVGLRATVAQPLAAGTRCRVRWLTDERIEARATVVRAQAGDLALRFDRLPQESCERLRPLLLLLAGDPAAIAAELGERLGFLGDD